MAAETAADPVAGYLKSVDDRIKPCRNFDEAISQSGLRPAGDHGQTRDIRVSFRYT